ncbi:MAG: twin-arginine translocase subunit TatC [Arenimonas sp.]
MNDERPVTESLLAHLLELRSRLLKAVVTVLVAFMALVPFANQLFTALAQPLLPFLGAGERLQAVRMFSNVLVPYKLAFWLALLLAMPVVLYQAWAFVAPGLYRNERKLALPLLVVATVLFYAGVAGMWFGMLPLIFDVLVGAGPEIVANMPDITEYLDFVMIMLIGGGVAAEIPVGVAVAVLVGAVTPRQLAQWRGYVVVVIFILAAILTPPDGLTQVLLALPMWALFELGLLWARLLVRRKVAA